MLVLELMPMQSGKLVLRLIMSNLMNFRWIILFNFLKIQFKLVITIQSDLVQADQFQPLYLMHDEDELLELVISH